MIIYKDIISGALPVHVLTLPAIALLMFILLSSLFTSFCRFFLELPFNDCFFDSTIILMFKATSFSRMRTH